MKPHSQAIANSPLRTVVKVALVIVLTEILIMLVFQSPLVTILGQYIELSYLPFMDAVLLTLMVVPALHVLVLQPMREQ